MQKALFFFAGRPRTLARARRRGKGLGCLSRPGVRQPLSADHRACMRVVGFRVVYPKP